MPLIYYSPIADIRGFPVFRQNESCWDECPSTWLLMHTTRVFSRIEPGKGVTGSPRYIRGQFYKVKSVFSKVTSLFTLLPAINKSFYCSPASTILIDCDQPQMILICCYLIINEVEHLFTCIFSNCVFFCEMPICVFCTIFFFLFLLSSSYLLLGF